MVEDEMKCIAGTASAPNTFVHVYFQYFIYALGGGFLIRLIFIGFAFLDIRF